jgi:hypothetical protein
MGLKRITNKEFLLRLEERILKGVRQCDPVLERCPSPEEGVRQMARRVRYESYVPPNLWTTEFFG